jgi:glycosyltransferase involved in cell wall biosynthesis
MANTQMSSKKKSVMIVCMVDSIHSARWLEIYRNKGIDFHIFPSTPNRKIHPKIRNLVEDSSTTDGRFKLVYRLKYLSILLWAIDLVFNNRFRGYLISRYAKKHNVDIIHAVELNHAGYMLSRASSFGLPTGCKIIVTSWGSDIFWFKRYPKHRERLASVLSIANEFISECSRDHKFATDLGFSGKFWEPTPVSGGYSNDFIKTTRTKTSMRKIILIKGYESFVGRASIALEAILNLTDRLTEYEIHVYSANRKTQRLVKKLRLKKQLKIIVYKKHALTHEQMLSLFSKARVYLGVSLSDGISVSLLESMVTGAFPIQTDTSCANEWILNGETGFIVKPKVDAVMNALRIAISDDLMVDNAMLKNSSLASEKLDQTVIYSRLSKLYN